MARRKKKAPPAAAPPRTAPAIGTSFRELLERARPAVSPPQDEPAPGPVRAPAPASPPPQARGTARSTGELAAWNEAYRGVVPLRKAKRASRPAQPAPADAAAVTADEQSARQRLSALVAGGVRFRVDWHDGYVLASREGLDRGALQRRLGGRGFSPEASLDLHGQRYADAALAVERFVRAERRRGRRYLLLVVGKGHHSEGGRGVLADAAVEALTRGGAAPVVAGFASAHASHGGTGAIAVALC